VTDAVHQTGTLAAALGNAQALIGPSPELAGEQAREILRVVPNEPNAQLILAKSLLRTGQVVEASKSLQAMVAARPDFVAAWLELAQACEAQKQGDKALACYERVVAIRPDVPSAWLGISRHRAAVGDVRGSDAANAHFLKHSTRDPALLMAASAMCDGRVADAERLLKARLFEAPKDVAAMRMLAEVAVRLGRNEDARSLLQRCLELAPGFLAARQNYAMVLHRENEPELALAELDAILESDRENPSALNLKAAVLCRVGDYVPAIEIYQRVIAQYPDQPRLWLSYGHALKTSGQREQSINAYRECVKLDPGMGEAYWSLANLKTFRFEKHEVGEMQRQLSRSDLDPEHRCQFEFALGKAFEDEGAYEQSFQHYAAGNAQRQALMPYSADDSARRVRRNKAIFTEQFFAGRSGCGAEAADPIFIVGLPRSGSTLIEQILSSHSMVEGTMELPEIISMTRDLRRQAGVAQLGSYHEMLAALPRDGLRELGELYLQRTRIQRKQGTPFFIDKMPNNFFHVGLIHLALPNAKIIDARRHPLACCVSGFKQFFARGQNFSYSLEDIGKYYCDYVELMAHFDRVLPGRMHRVFYERMVDETEIEVRQLLSYCGLPFEAQCLKFFENDRPVRTASSEQVRQPIYREGVDHWRNFEPHLDPLKHVLGPVLDSYPDIPATARFA
jgi:predicted Zn-dependent protease